MERLNYIAVEGPIGVGKSTLARMLAEDLGSGLILEEADENPFLGRFYENPDKYAFQTQMFFLLSRYRQQVELNQRDLFHHKTVCDYIFAKDQIFASLNLSQEEMDLYLNVYNLFSVRLPKPDLVVFLQANPDILMKRVKKRKKDYEKALRSDYIESLLQAYNSFFFQYSETPLLVVNTSGIDFVENKEDYQTIKKELLHLWQSKQQKHYVTIDSR